LTPRLPVIGRPGARLPALGQGLRRGLGPGGGLLGDEGAPTARLQAKDAAGECASGTGSIVVAHVDDFPVSDTEYLDIGKAEVLPPYLSVYFQLYDYDLGVVRFVPDN
jgi:hypothetical protein